MTPPTDIRIQISFATSQLKPSPIIGDDLTAPREHYEGLLRANVLAEQGRLHIHKAIAVENHRDGETLQKEFLSDTFDSKMSNGKREMAVLFNAVADSVMKRLYPKKEGRVVG